MTITLVCHDKFKVVKHLKYIRKKASNLKLKNTWEKLN